ncbi:MAG: hypothetical protein K2M62_05020 [Muribaculaceae bacterium]|nr:hypothetical protein [Muribaculaceae bacterium]
MASSTVKGRLLEYLYHKRISQIEFTRMLGVSSTYVGAMRRSISDEKMLKIRRLFPDLNPDWLLYGSGEMLKDDNEKDSMLAQMEAQGVKMVPLVPVSAYGGGLQAYSEGIKAADCEMVVSQVHDAEMAIRVSGHSMEPNIPDGAFLFVKKINDRSFIPWGNAMVVDTSNGTVVKCLYPVSASAEEIEARSYNPDFPPFRIPTDTVFGLYRILATLTINTTL